VFLAPMTAFLEANLRALSEAGYPLPPRVQPPADWELDTSATEPHLRVPGPAGVTIAVHSRRDPRTEAARAVADAGLTPAHSVALVVGVGLGYAVEAVWAQRPDLPIVAAEADLARLVPFLCRRDWTREIAQGALGLFWPDLGIDARGLRRLLEAREDEGLLRLTHPVLANVAATQTSTTLAAFRRFWQGARANRAARLAFEGRYADHTLANLSRLDGMFDLRRLVGGAAGFPAMVVAAGPSLDAQLEDIREARRSAWLIAVDTALRPLLAAGVDPDFVIAVDPSELNARHLLDLAPRTQARLVGELSLPPALFDAFEGRAIPFRVGLNEPWPWLVPHVLDLAILTAWGSVLVTAIDFACHLGADPVLLCAADLAYTGARPYCRGTTFGRNAAVNGETEDQFAKRWMALVADGLVTLDDIHGRPTHAPSHFPSIRDAIVDLASRRAAHQIVNTTNAGILAGGRIRQQSLRQAVAEACAATPERRRHALPEHGTLATGLRYGQYQAEPEWHVLVHGLGQAWPQQPETATAAFIAVLRGLALARSRPGHGLPFSTDACGRWLAPFADTPLTGDIVRILYALNAAIPEWYADLEPTLVRALDEAVITPATYLGVATWIVKSVGDALVRSPARDVIDRMVERLFRLHRTGGLPDPLAADLASLALASGRTIADVEPIITHAADRVGERSVITEALQALWFRARGAALLAETAAISTSLTSTAAGWFAIEREAGRETMMGTRQMVLLAMASNQCALAEEYLRDGLARHAALAESGAAIAGESWFCGHLDFARRLLDLVPPINDPPATLLFHLGIAHTLLGDHERGRQYLARLRTICPSFFSLTASPNNRWFLLACAARALGDQAFATRVGEIMRRWDPLARQREALAPTLVPAFPALACPDFELPAHTENTK
jgi:hypothetical protein